MGDVEDLPKVRLETLCLKVISKVQEETFEKYLEKRDQFNPAEFFASRYLGFELEYFITTELLEFNWNPAFLEYLS